MFNGIKAVYYREIEVMRTRIMRSIVASMVSPALFMLAFGYGLGRRQIVGGVEYLDFLFVGLLAMSTLNACYSVATDINISRFYFKTFDEYLTAPIPRRHIVIGETLYGLTKGTINIFVFFIYAFIVKLNIGLSPLFIMVLLMHMTVFSLLGFIIALLVKNHKDQSSINTFLIVPMTFLSGVFFPVEQAPFVIQTVVQFFPLSHSVALMREALTGTGASLYHMAMLIAFLVTFFFFAIRLAVRTEG